MTTRPSRYLTRAAVNAGLAEAPEIPRDTPRPPSPSGSQAGADSRDAGTPKSRPVTPELLYSKVVMGSLVPSNGRGGSPVSFQEHGGSTGRVSASAQLSELPSPTRDVGFTDGDPRGLDSPEAALWIPETRKTARTHSTGSGSSDHLANLNENDQCRLP
ncbi:hypothetical protein GGX14DRAFT_390213 [Mycena pura]|uniref:Uncharacterized protein n=1 Tax=Mycena pura TaxID=153505 RepID=A0AAD6VQ08_9AGAR|nr:hypothetical protein GGX14DRAFT_390213 [Mycena pura]